MTPGPSARRKPSRWTQKSQKSGARSTACGRVSIPTARKAAASQERPAIVCQSASAIANASSGSLKKSFE